MPIFEYALRQHMRERLRHQAVSQATLKGFEDEIEVFRVELRDAGPPPGSQ